MARYAFRAARGGERVDDVSDAALAELVRFLAEDLEEVRVSGPAARERADPAHLSVHDLTTRALANPESVVRAQVIAREVCVTSGVAYAAAVFQLLGARVTTHVLDGARVSAGDVVMTVEGDARVWTAERVALNVMMRMSGIATLTAQLQAAVSAVSPSCRVAATRKTTPGFRRFEKAAVVHGGGDPHRFGLFDAFLVKDNHLAGLAGGVKEAVQRCRALDATKFLQVEADTAEQARAAAGAGADAVLLDNFTPANARALYDELKADHPHLLVEVSGGISADNVVEFAAGADRISMGALTHSAPAVDFGLDAI